MKLLTQVTHPTENSNNSNHDVTFNSAIVFWFDLERFLNTLNFIPLNISGEGMMDIFIEYKSQQLSSFPISSNNLQTTNTVHLNDELSSYRSKNYQTIHHHSSEITRSGGGMVIIDNEEGSLGTLFSLLNHFLVFLEDNFDINTLP